MSSPCLSTPMASLRGTPALASITSSQAGPVQLTVPFEAGTWAISLRADVGTAAPTTRHEPSPARLVCDRHLVTPYTSISVPAVGTFFQVSVVVQVPGITPPGSGPL